MTRSALIDNKKGIDKHSSVALLMIDVINDLNFPESDEFLKHGLAAAKRLAFLKKKCQAAEIPVIYVNDNFGIWRSDFKSVVNHCIAKASKGSEISRLLQPSDDDYFVLKPKHSGFFSTTLNVLLEYLQVRTLLIGGFAGNICVLFTANDAYMREYRLFVPSDCSASNSTKENDEAMTQIEKVLKADIRPAADLVKLSMFRKSKKIER